MSVDRLQEKIRKVKNPTVLTLEAVPALLPPAFAEGKTVAAACDAYYRSVLAALKGTVGAVRFGFGSFALWGQEGFAVLRGLMREAKKLGMYVLVDAPELLSPMAAENLASAWGSEDTELTWDGLVFSAYLGSDILKPLLPLCARGKALFPVVRTANRSAPEVQDLLTGARLVHTALADIVTRQGEPYVGKFGYSQVGAVAGASGADSLRTLRTKYPKLFLLLDGADYPNANAKNCGYAFDKLGRGAAACSCAGILAAWKNGEGEDPVAAAVEAAERMKRNLTRYITVL